VKIAFHQVFHHFLETYDWFSVDGSQNVFSGLSSKALWL